MHYSRHQIALAATLSLSLLAATRPVRNIRLFDFRNFRYVVGGQEVRVRNGTGRVPSDADPLIQIEITHIDVTYGDLTGHGREEAGVVIGFREGGTGYFTAGYVYGIQNGGVQLLATFPGGDRAHGGIVRVHIAHGRLSVARNHSPGDAVTTDAVVITTYALPGRRNYTSSRAGSRR